EGELPALLAQAIASVPAGDTEAALQVLNEHRQAVAFRLALALLGERLAPVDAARRLAALAEAVLAQALQLAEAAVVSGHRRVPGAGLAVIGYGSLGGRELGFGSDLDLVFLHDAPMQAQADGPRPLDRSVGRRVG